ncbi:MAG: hypothetical protein KBD01_12970 [Acidobacteria bacterium]|nr:hypothetical protein [Acidobacteriota bacterium]
MDREFTYTKERLRFILERLLEDDVRGSTAYLADARAEEGFEKRAALEFLLWFLDKAIPEQFRFQCQFENLESDYPEAIARIIAAGRGWSAGFVRERATDANVVLVDFKPKS